MIIDSHVHAHRGDGRDLIDAAKRNGIDKICLSSLGDTWVHDPNPSHFVNGNRQVEDWMAKFPDEVLGFCYVNPQHHEESVAEIERCINAGMVGIKLWVACFANEPQVFPIAEKAIELGVPILQHAWIKATGNLPKESTPFHVADLASRYPDLKIIMAHLTGNGRRGVLAIKDCPNVSVDTSGGNPETGTVETAVEALGAERVIFGSDAPGRAYDVQLGRIYGAVISDDQRDLVLGGNMERLLSLS